MAGAGKIVSPCPLSLLPYRQITLRYHAISVRYLEIRVGYYKQSLSVQDMARHMAEHNTVFSEGSITGILIDFVKCIREQVLMGNTVKIDNLAIFKASVEANGLEVLYDAEQDKVAQATMGTLAEGAKTGPAVKVIKLLAQSTGDFTREELKKDVKFSWTDKTKAEIAAAKGESTSGGGASGGSDDSGDGPTNEP
jgi:hypothetical protein